MTIKIDPEFRSLLAPLSPDEYNQLQANIRDEGCREPLIVWQGEDILLDGHNRLKICNELGISYQTREQRFPTRDAAFNWIIANQLGRRNLTPEQVAYLRGKRYQGEKKKLGGHLKRNPQNEDDPKRTCDKLADEYGVSPNTIQRDGTFSEAVDTIAATLGEETKQAILTGEIKQPRAIIAEAAKVAKVEPEKAREILAGEKPDTNPTNPTPGQNPRRWNPHATTVTCDSRFLKITLGKFLGDDGARALARTILTAFGTDYAVKVLETIKRLMKEEKNERKTERPIAAQS